MDLDCAPVQDFEVVAAPVFVGYAAPSHGRKPCVVEVFSNDILVASTVAAEFSSQAVKAGLRNGWCGFSLPSLQEAFALGGHANLYCKASRRLLRSFSLEDVESFDPTPNVVMGPMEILTHVRSKGGAQSPRQILEFADDFRTMVGLVEFLEATFKMFLGRNYEKIKDDKLFRIKPTDNTLDILSKIVNSSEYKKANRLAITGPFQEGFLYGLRRFD